MTLRDATKTATRLPAQDLDRARAFYAAKLGLEPADERPGGILYRVGDTEFALFASGGRATGDHTQMGFEVEDIEATVGAVADLGYGLVGGIGEYEGIWKMAYVRGPEGIVVSVSERIG